MVVVGGRWKSQNRKNVYHSPYVDEPFNSKVIKSFGPDLRSRKCFFVFRNSYVLSLWTFDVRFTHSHILSMVHYHSCMSGGRIAGFIPFAKVSLLCEMKTALLRFELRVPWSILFDSNHYTTKCDGVGKIKLINKYMKKQWDGLVWFGFMVYRPLLVI